MYGQLSRLAPTNRVQDARYMERLRRSDYAFWKGTVVTARRTHYDTRMTPGVKNVVGPQR